MTDAPLKPCPELADQLRHLLSCTGPDAEKDLAHFVHVFQDNILAALTRPDPAPTGEVTQGDRDAAASMWDTIQRCTWADWQGDWLRDGTGDSGPLTQAFRNHRLQSTTALRHDLRMIVAHASGGHVDLDEAGPLSINEICVRISRHHNRIWESAQERTTALEDTIRGLREALEEAEEVFALVEHPALTDPDYHSEIYELGARIGFGALMSGASAEWRKSAIVAGSEFVSGPCQATVTRVLAIIRLALSHDGDASEGGGL